MVNNLINLSDAGFKFITQPSFDSFHAIPYRDSGGLWTVGYGQRISAADAVKYKDGITEEFGKKLFDSYISGLTKKLSDCPLHGLFQYQHDAIIAFSYNIGFEAFIMSTPYRQIMTRNGDLTTWLDYVYDATHHRDEGLVLRREKELKLFVFGLY